MVSLIKVSKRNKAGTLSFTIPTEAMDKNKISKGQLFSVEVKNKNIVYTLAKNKNQNNTVKASQRNKNGTLSFTIPKSIIKILTITEKDQFLVYAEEKSVRFERI